MAEKNEMSDGVFYFWLALGVFGALLLFLGGGVLYFSM